MQSFDNHFVEEVIERLGNLKPDTMPAWGKMSPAEMICHLIGALRYSMGREGKGYFIGNFFSTRILAPIVLSGFFRLPKNLNMKDTKGEMVVFRFPGDLETLHAILLEYLDLVQTGELEPEQHPVFGDLGIDGWAKLHVIHFEHHMRQFRI